MSTIILGSVGRSAANQPGDVRTVQRLLNDHFNNSAKNLATDGVATPQTIAAIERFQQEIKASVSGVIKPGDQTIRKLAEAHIRRLVSVIAPKTAKLGLPGSKLPSLSFEPLLQAYWEAMRRE
jgi:peptidoglycan hydrolase-like protein with peptidoglycan-binding domain